MSRSRGGIHSRIFSTIAFLAAFVSAIPAIAADKWEIVKKTDPIDDRVTIHGAYEAPEVHFIIHCKENRAMFTLLNKERIYKDKIMVRYRLDEQKAKAHFHSVYGDHIRATQGIFESKDLIKYLSKAQNRIVVQIDDRPSIVIKPDGLTETAKEVFANCGVEW